MNKIEIYAPAKINIFLNVLNKREDGFHNISTIMQSISLYDKIIIEKNNNNKINISSSEISLPRQEENIAWRAAKALLMELNLTRGYDIYIEKNIPWCAGLGGASTNAAAVINGILSIENIELEIERKIKIVEQIGSDIPYFFYGGTCIAKSKGEIVKPISNMDRLWILIVKPEGGISTPRAYKEIDSNIATKLTAEDVMEGIEQIQFKNIEGIMYNIFEPIAQKQCDDIKKIKEEMKENYVYLAQMTGSGSAVFAVLENEEEARELGEKIKANNNNRKCYISHTIDCGIIMSGYENINLKWSEIYAK